jgi:hypothetical protein
MHKKFLALILCSLFAVGKTEALCCFSKKAVEREPDQRALVRQITRLIRQNESNIYANRVKDLAYDLDEQSYITLIKALNPGVVIIDEKCNKEAQDNAIGVAWPLLPPGLSALITGYLWQECRMASSGSGWVQKDRVSSRTDAEGRHHYSNTSLFDSNEKNHEIVSKGSRRLYRSLRSLRLVEYSRAKEIHDLCDYYLSRSDGADNESAERELAKLQKEHNLPFEVLERARRGEHLLAPVLDEEEEKYDV